MNITIAGGGNIGTQLAVHCSNAGHQVTIFTSRPDKFCMRLSIVDSTHNEVMNGKLHKATSDPQGAFGTAELVIVTLPSFCFRSFSELLLPFVRTGMKLTVIPGAFGELFFKKHIERGAALFGLQRVPSVARLVEYGKTVCATGYRNELFAAAIPGSYTSAVCKLMEEITDIKCSPIPCFLSLTLTPSNPILHTTRLRTIFKDYIPGASYESLPLFYEGWTDESSELLLRSDDEVQALCRKLDRLDLSHVRSLREHYEVSTAEQMTDKISGIAGFQGLPTPYVKTQDRFTPDFDSRYFKADFAIGLEIIRQFAAITQTPAPNINETIEWYYKVTGSVPSVQLGEFGIHNIDDIYSLYSP